MITSQQGSQLDGFLSNLSMDVTLGAETIKQIIDFSAIILASGPCVRANWLISNSLDL